MKGLLVFTFGQPTGSLRQKHWPSFRISTGLLFDQSPSPIQSRKKFPSRSWATGSKSSTYPVRYTIIWFPSYLYYIIINIIAGLIAEAIRRHHYCESVAMISYCLNSQPLIKNPTGDVVLAAEGPSSASQMKVVEKNPVRNPGIERLRKGFRLSSKCWD